jgi:hypothetical protein
VLLIVMDTVRASSLGIYGYTRDTTPQLARWARQGVLFEWAVAPAPWTLPSLCSFLTGQWPSTLGAHWKPTLDRNYPALAEFLASRGYLTAGFVANTFWCSFESEMNRGFVHYEDYPLSLRVIIGSSALGRWLLENAQAPGGFDGVRWVRSQSRDAAGINRAFLDWHRIATPVSLRDLPATIVDLAGLGQSGARFPGSSLAAHWRAGPPTGTSPRKRPLRSRRYTSQRRSLPNAAPDRRSAASPSRSWPRAGITFSTSTAPRSSMTSRPTQRSFATSRTTRPRALRSVACERGSCRYLAKTAIRPAPRQATSSSSEACWSRSWPGDPGEPARFLDSGLSAKTSARPCVRYRPAGDLRAPREVDHLLRGETPASPELNGREKGTGPFCRNAPKGASHKMDLSPFRARWRATGTRRIAVPKSRKVI